MKEGDRLQLLKQETKPEWLGWIYCRAKIGKEGWIFKDLLKITGEQATALEDYDAIELNASPTDEVEVF